MGKAAFALSVAALLTVLSLRASAVEPQRPGSDLIRGIVAEGQLWLLSESGALASISLGDRKLTTGAYPDPVLDMCARDGRLEAVAGKAGLAQWTLVRRTGNAWSVEATIANAGDMLMGLDCGSTGLTLLTTHRLIMVRGTKQDAVALSQAFARSALTTILGTASDLFVGLDAGEWGGGLRRIDRRTGSVTILQRNASNAMCGGPLNTACDPVNGLARDPWSPSCIAAAIGLVHFAPHGRIIEVCGDRVKRLYFKPYVWNSQNNRMNGDEPFSTVAFFGLAGGDDVLWAAGIDGLYEIQRDGTARTIPLPHFEDIGGLYVSFDIPHFIVVLTDANRRRSISGSVPMLIARSGE